MKSNLILAFTLLLLICVVILFAKLNDLKKENLELIKLQAAPTMSDGESFEIAQYMSSIQVHFSKLYFAGKSQNQELAAFYLHELEESFEKIVEENVVDEGHNISAFAKQFGLNPVELMHETVESEGLIKFDQDYENLINNCNSCHNITDHEFIQIIVPKTPPFDNQSFEPRQQ